MPSLIACSYSSTLSRDTTFFSVTLSMRKLLTAFSSERGLKGCRVRLCPGRDGSAKRERLSALARWPLRIPEDWGRCRRGEGWRPYAVR